MEEAEVGTAVIVFHSKGGLVDHRIRRAVVQQSLHHTDKAIKVDIQVVIHLDGHVVLMGHSALVQQLYIGL